MNTKMENSMFALCNMYKTSIYSSFKEKFSMSVQFSSVVQSCPTLCNLMDCSHVRLFATSWTAASLSITNSQSLLKLMSIESVMPSNHLIQYGPFLLPPIFPSIRFFSNKLAPRIRWPKYWELQLQHQSFQ